MDNTATLRVAATTILLLVQSGPAASAPLRRDADLGELLTGTVWLGFVNSRKARKQVFTLSDFGTDGFVGNGVTYGGRHNLAPVTLVTTYDEPKVVTGVRTDSNHPFSVEYSADDGCNTWVQLPLQVEGQGTKDYTARDISLESLGAAGPVTTRCTRMTWADTRGRFPYAGYKVRRPQSYSDGIHAQFTGYTRTEQPTNAPTESPTNAPAESPTNAPTESPTSAPTAHPTAYPTAYPTAHPTTYPTAYPTTPSCTAVGWVPKSARCCHLEWKALFLRNKWCYYYK
jgi:hypothetical protein